MGQCLDPWVSILEQAFGRSLLSRKGFTMVQTAGLMVCMRIIRANGDNGAKRANEANKPSEVNCAT